jgi:hypothetical protein
VTAAPARLRALPSPRRPARARPVIPAPGLADPATQQRRRLQLAAIQAGFRVRSALLPDSSVRRRQRLQVCSAARILTALGVRVRVVQPATPWPRNRPHRLLASGDLGWLGELALLTAVPRTTSGWPAIGDRVLPIRPTFRARPAPESADAVLCPVAVHFRVADGSLKHGPRSLAEIVAVQGLVAEVYLLPALDTSIGTRDELPVAA